MPLAPYGRAYAAKRTWQGTGAPSAITTLDAALVTEVVLDTDSGTTIIEPTAASYERVPITLSAAEVAIDTSGSGSFINRIDWPEVTEGTWGTVVGYAFLHGDDLFAYGTVPETTLSLGDQPKIPAGSLLLTVTD